MVFKAACAKILNTPLFTTYINLSPTARPRLSNVYIKLVDPLNGMAHTEYNN